MEALENIDIVIMNSRLRLEDVGDVVRRSSNYIPIFILD